MKGKKLHLHESVLIYAEIMEIYIIAKMKPSHL